MSSYNDERRKVDRENRVWLSTVIADRVGNEAYWDLVKESLGNPQMIFVSAEDLLDQKWAQEHLPHVWQLVEDSILRVECWNDLSQRLLRGYWFSSCQMMTRPCQSLEEVWEQLPKDKVESIRKLYNLVMMHGVPREKWHTPDCVDPPREVLTEEEAEALGLPCTANQSQIIEAAKRLNVDSRAIVVRLMKAVAEQHNCGVLLGENAYLSK